MKAVYLKNFRKGLATNSSSTHSLIYRNDGEVMNDLDVLDVDFYDRCTRTIAASKQAKIKYVLATIMYNEPLVRIMSEIYPEMKDYFPKIKDTMENEKFYGDDGTFGMYNRGNFDFSNNIQASVEYLRNVIDNKDIIIIGGSDEEDFVYDILRDHVQCPDPDMVRYGSRSKNFGVTKNGNYWVGYGDTNDRVVVECVDDGYVDNQQIKDSFCGKIRFATSSDPIVPEYPELIDLKLTNMCNHGCKFCFMDSNVNGKHADKTFIKSLMHQLGNRHEDYYHRIEFSIGGGNILLYPDLEEVFKCINEHGHIINVTIKADDCDTILNDPKLLSIFKKYVDGIGVSVFSVQDAEKMKEFKDEINKNINRWENKSYKFVVAHIIPEYLGVDKTKEIVDVIKWNAVLFLGYKTNGRGSSQEYKNFTNDELYTLFKDLYSVSVDTTFSNRYFDWIKNNFSYKYTLTLNEGEYSMYIDAVDQKAYKSSYQLDKPYNMKYVSYKDRETNPVYNIKEAFTNIRKDGGFTLYDDVKKHYYSDSKHYWA